MLNSDKFGLLIVLVLSVCSYQAVSGATGKCAFNQWKCDDGECILRDWRCDGRPNCIDGSDEIAENCIHMHCPAFAYRCAYGGCIAGKYKCNGRGDCADNSDETPLLCYGNTEELEAHTAGNCSSDTSFQCKTAECIDIDRRCDGALDCRDGSDESVEFCAHVFCPLYAFRCGYGGCIPGNAKCDGVNDCADGSDEAADLCGYERRWNNTHAHVPPTATAEPPILLPGCIIPFNRKHLVLERAITLAVLEYGTRVAADSIVTFRCDHGWQLDGVIQNACLRDQWMHDLPTCNKNCSYATLQQGLSTVAACFYNKTSINCGGPLNVGTKALITCAPGYRTRGNKGSQLTLTCDEDAEWDYPKFKCKAQCGLWSDDQRVENPVLPWDVSIFKRSFSPVFYRICGGAIVSAKMVITTANCFANNDPVLYNIVQGHHTKLYQQGDTIDGVIHNISEIILTEQHMSHPASVKQHLALLVLVNHFQFSGSVMPICLQFQKLPRDELLPYDIVDTLKGTPKEFLDTGSAVSYKLQADGKSSLIAIVGGKFSDGRISLVQVYYFKQFIKRQLKRYNYLL